jgi:hypothetical protein
MKIPRKRMVLVPHPGLRVCCTCGGLFGPVQAKGGQTVEQRCRCGPPDTGPGWPGFDFNSVAELCRCCGQELLRSGSRYSVWFCSDCKEQVRLLNARLRRYAIPLGRHSLHGGFLLSPRQDEASLTLEIEVFVDRWRNISEAMGALEAWAGEVVRQVVHERGLDPGGGRADGAGSPESVPIRDYLHSCRTDEREKMRRFRDMVAFLESWGAKKGEEARGQV